VRPGEGTGAAGGFPPGEPEGAERTRGCLCKRFAAFRTQELGAVMLVMHGTCSAAPLLSALSGETEAQSCMGPLS